MQLKKQKMTSKKLKEYITTIETTSTTILNIYKILKIIFPVLSLSLTALFFAYKQFQESLIDIFQQQILKTPAILKLWQILLLLLILSFCILFYYYKKNKKLKNKFKYYEIPYLDIKFRWTYDIFNMVIIDFPPFCMKDNTKLQIKDDTKIFNEATEFICPICEAMKPKKEIYHKYKEIKKLLKKKYNKLSYYDTISKAKITINDSSIEKIKR